MFEIFCKLNSRVGVDFVFPRKKKEGRKQKNNPHLASSRRNGPICRLKFGDCLVGVWRVFGNCLDVVWRVSGGCLEVVLRVSGRCLEGALMVSGGYLWDVQMVIW